MKHTMSNKGFQKLLHVDTIEGRRDRRNSDYFT